jgi:Nif-specific regulatory protein
MVAQPVISKVRLNVKDGGGGPPTEQTLSGPLVQVGRGTGNDLSFVDPRVSTVHGRLVIDSDRVAFVDLGSTNGSAIIRDGKRMAVTRDSSEGFELQESDQVLLGDADQPSSIYIVEIIRTAALETSDATVVAQRALGEVAGLPEGQTLKNLLALLAELRIESDSLECTRKVMNFLLGTLPEASRAEFFMKDSTGRLAPVVGLGPQSSSIVATPPASALSEKLLSDREAILVFDTQRVDAPSASIRTSPSRSVILAPIIIEDEVIGAIQIGSKQGGVFGEHELDLVSVLAQQLSTVLSGARLIERLRQAEARLRGECDYLKERFGQRPAIEEMIGSSASIREVQQQIRAVAPSRTTVLIQGETGVGKELVARAIHEQSPRNLATFAAVNCSALSVGLLESELFGHCKGAFTGAHRDRKGLFEVAHGGTLFLDEIGEMPTDLQPKLLRCLEEGIIMPVGSTKPRQVDVRLVCATNRNLEEEVKCGRFRQDLLFRINVFTFSVPALRDRQQDIIPIARHFIERFSNEHGRQHPGLGADVIAALQSYAWPGNIRELKNEMERASLLAPQDLPIELSHLSERLGGGSQIIDQVDGNLKESMERLEKVVVQAALKQHDHNRTQCARSLGISRQALITKIARLGIKDD